MPQMSLAQGILPLTQGAADAALDAIDLITAVVRGFNATDITSIVKPICANTVNQMNVMSGRRSNGPHNS
jgi:hypothetical protein